MCQEIGDRWVQNAAPLCPSAEVRITATYGRLVLTATAPAAPVQITTATARLWPIRPAPSGKPVQTGSLRGDLWSTWSIGALPQSGTRGAV